MHFVRHLTALTPEEIERMEALNPKSAEQWKEEEEARRFLQGEDVRPCEDAGAQGTPRQMISDALAC